MFNAGLASLCQRLELPVYAETVQPGCLHHIEGERLYASNGDAILTGQPGRALTVLVRLRVDLATWAISRQRALRRLFRRHIYHIRPFEDRLVVMGFRRIWCLNGRTGAVLGKPVPISGSRPLALCGTDHGLYYGEYGSNPSRDAMRVFFSEDGLTWTAIREVKGVRHIHGIYHDPHTDALWMTTGDEDGECGIWQTKDRFASVRCVVRGSQQVRAVSLLFTPRHVLFGSDTPMERNHLYALDRRTGDVEQLIPVEGSVLHGTTAGSCFLFSTAVEPSGVNKTASAVLYVSRDGKRWSEAACHRKDMWHMKYFQYGQLLLPSGHNETGRFWYSTLAVRRDGQIYSGRLDDLA